MGSGRGKRLLALVCGLGLFVCVPVSGMRALDGDLDRDGIEDGREQRLLERYAPVYVFHPEEKNFSDSVEKYLQKVTLRFHYRGLPDDEILPVGEVNRFNIGNQVHRNKNLLGQYTQEQIRSDQERNTFLDGGYFLEVPDSSNQTEVYRGDWKLERSQVYGHAYLGTDQKIRLQYWLFFPYNVAPNVAGVQLNHEGDWEHVTLRLDEKDQLQEIYYASHNQEGRWWKPEKVLFTDSDLTKRDFGLRHGTHPVVYVALGTHASFATAGEQDRGWYLPKDYTGEGAVFSSVGKIIQLGERSFPANGAEFLTYSGLWGEIGMTPISTGPKTPSYQEAWLEE